MPWRPTYIPVKRGNVDEPKLQSFDTVHSRRRGWLTTAKYEGDYFRLLNFSRQFYNADKIRFHKGKTGNLAIMTIEYPGKNLLEAGQFTIQAEEMRSDWNIDPLTKQFKIWWHPKYKGLDNANFKLLIPGESTTQEFPIPSRQIIAALIAGHVNDTATALLRSETLANTGDRDRIRRAIQFNVENYISLGDNATGQQRILLRDLANQIMFGNQTVPAYKSIIVNNALWPTFANLGAFYNPVGYLFTSLQLSYWINLNIDAQLRYRRSGELALCGLPYGSAQAIRTMLRSRLFSNSLWLAQMPDMKNTDNNSVQLISSWEQMISERELNYPHPRGDTWPLYPLWRGPADRPLN